MKKETLSSFLRFSIRNQSNQPLNVPKINRKKTPASVCIRESKPKVVQYSTLANNPPSTTGDYQLLWVDLCLHMVL